MGKQHSSESESPAIVRGFDAELAAEMLLVRMNAAEQQPDDQTVAGLTHIFCRLRNGPDSMEEAAAQLEQLLTHAAPPRLEY